jgi:comEA protein
VQRLHDLIIKHRSMEGGLEMVRSFLLKLGMLAVTLSMIGWIGWSVPSDHSAAGVPPSRQTVAQEPVAPSSETPPSESRQVPPSPPASVTKIAPTPAPVATVRSPQASLGRVDLNQATVDDIDRLPGLGPTLAQRVIDYRRANGPFSTVDDLLSVKGIGPKKLARLRDLVVIRGDHAGTD